MVARIASFTIFLLLAFTSPALAQDKVYQSITPDQMELLLKGMKLEFKKVSSQAEPGVFYYDFARGKRNIRLSLFHGKDIMLDILFQEYPLEMVNRWNRQAKFSRASLHKDDKGGHTALEANLDLIGGVTDQTVRQFFKTFGEELTAFDKFTTPSVAPILPPGNDRILSSVTSENVETILKTLNITCKKQALKADKSFSYQYEAKKYKISLYNFGSKDLMLDAVFKKVPLEVVNKYNFERKFVRAVVYNQGGQEYTTLETNMDLTGGVSETMIRHFLITFEEEAQVFADFISKNS